MQLKPFILRKGTKTALSIYKLKGPVLIPMPKEIKFFKKNIVLIDNGKSNFSIQLNNKEPELKKIISGEIVEEYGKSLDSGAETIISLNIGGESEAAKNIQLPEKMKHMS